MKNVATIVGVIGGIVVLYLLLSRMPTSPVSTSGGVATGNAANARDGLRLVTNMQKSGDTFASDPAVVPSQVNGKLPQITVSWAVVGASAVEIHMASPKGALFARGGNAGTAATGNWVVSGATFYLQDVSGGSPGKTIATMVATPCHGCV